MPAHSRIVARLRPEDRVHGRIRDGTVFDTDVVSVKHDQAGVRVVLIPTGVSWASTRWRLRVDRIRGEWSETKLDQWANREWESGSEVVELWRESR